MRAAERSASSTVREAKITRTGLALAALFLAATLTLRSAEAGAANICGAGGIATSTWDGGASTSSWHDAANWSGDEVPQSDDHVCIPNTAIAAVNYSTGTTSVLSLESQEALNVTGGSLSFTDNGQDSTIGALTLASNVGVTLGGASNLTVGDFDWNGGTISASSPTTTTTVTGDLDVSRGNISNRTLNIPSGVTGSFTGSGVFSPLNLTTNAVLDIDAGGTLELTGDGDIGNTGDGTTLVRNDGTIAKSSGSGTSRFLMPVQANAAVQVQSGKVQFNRAVTADADGAGFALSGGTTLEFVGGGGPNALGPSTISDGAASATVSFGTASNTTLTAAGALDVNTVEVNGANNVTLSGANTIPNLDINSPSGSGLNGDANLTVGDLDWAGGTISASSPSTITTVTGSLDVSSGSISNRTLNIPSGVTGRFNGNAGVFSTLGLGTNAVLDIDAGGTFELTGDADLGSSDATTLVRNDGTLVKTGGGGSSRFLVPVLNNGEIETQTGTLQTANSLNNAGAVDVKAGTTVDVASSFSNFSGTTLTGGTYLVDGTFRLPGSTSIATNAATIDLDGAAAQIINRDNSLNGLRNLATNAAGGSLTIRNGKNLTTPGALANDGVLGIGQASTFTTTGNYTQAAGGTLRPEIGPAGHGRLVVNGGATLAGTLDILTAAGFTPAGGSTYEIESGARTGTFATVTGDDLPDGTHYDVQYGSASVTLAAEPPAPQISVGDGSAPEKHVTGTVTNLTVSLSSPAPAGGVTVDYDTADGTATAPGDYTSKSGQLTFNQGQASKTVQAVIEPDTDVEPDETFVVDLSNPAGATIADGQGTWTIENDDSPPGTPICGPGGIATKTWDGDAGSQAWFDPANWIPAGIPEGDDYVCLEDGSFLVEYDSNSGVFGSVDVVGLEGTNLLRVAPGSILGLTDPNHPSSVGILEVGGGANVSGAADLTVDDLRLAGTLQGDHRLDGPSAEATTTVTDTMSWFNTDDDGVLVPSLYNRTLRLAPGAVATGESALVMGLPFPPAGGGDVAARIEIQRDSVTGESATLRLDALAPQFATGRILLGEGQNVDGRIVNDGTIRKIGTVSGRTSLIEPPVDNNGSTVVEDGTLQLAGDFTNPATGVVDVRAGTTFDPTGTPPPATIGSLTNNGTLKGTGTVAANVTNAGTVAPGLSPGTLTVGGNYTQTAAGTLATEIAGTAASQFDRLVVNGTASLDGTLAIATDPAFTPPDGSTFQVETGTRTGQFATVTGANLPNGRHYDVRYAPANVTLETSCGSGIATKVWTGNASNSWHHPDNWAPSGVPGTTDHVCIPAGAGTITHSSTDPVPHPGTSSILSLEASSPVHISGETLNLTDTSHDSSASALTVDGGGTLGGAGDLTVANLSMGSNGRLVAPSNTTTTTVTNSASGAIVDNRTLVIAAGATATGSLTINAGARMELRSGATFVVSAHTQGSGTVLNEGVIRQSTGTFNLQFSPTLTNAGTIEVDSGGLSLTQAGPFTNPGTIEVGTGAIFERAGGFTNTGTIRGSGTVSGPLTNAGTIAPGLSTGTLRVAGDYTQTGAGTLAAEVAVPHRYRTDSDRLIVDGTAALGGTLAIDTDPAREPPDGQTARIMEVNARSGQFATVTGADLPSGAGWEVRYGVYNVTLGFNSDAPVLDGTDPNSPADFNNPKVIGWADTGSTVQIYKSADCSGAVAASGTAEQLASPGIAVSVPDNSDTNLSATATPAGGSASACSQPILYREDSTPPPVPEIRVTPVVDRPEGTSLVAPRTPYRFVVSLTSPAPAGGVSVRAEVADGDGFFLPPATFADNDYEGSGGNLTFAPGEISKSLTFDVLGDDRFERDELFYVRLRDAVGATIGSGFDHIPPNGAQGIIRNDDPLQVCISNNRTVEEDSGTHSLGFRVDLCGEAAPSKVTVDYATANGSATAPADYAAASGTVTFQAGETEKFIQVPVSGDTAVESDETFVVNLSNASDATIRNGQGTGTIENDDPRPQLSIDDVSAPEGNSGTKPFTFTVSLSAPAPAPARVNFATANGSAAAPGDYAAKSGQVAFAKGDTSKTVSIDVNGDVAIEASEDFFVNLSSPFGATIADGQGRGTIANDDLPAISIDDVSAQELNSGFQSYQFTVSLSSPAPPGGVSVDYATADGTANSPTDYEGKSSQITIPEGVSTRPVEVFGTGDIAVEPDETFFLDLSNASGANIADDRGIATIVNDDEPPAPTISIRSVTAFEGTKGTKLFRFQIVLSRPAPNGIISAEYSTFNGSALGGSDFSPVANRVIRFEPGETTKTADVSVNGDTTVEDTERFRVSLVRIFNAIPGETNATGTILNDDSAPTQTLDGSIDLTKSCISACTIQASGSLLLTRSLGKATGGADRAAGGSYQLKPDSKQLAAGEEGKLKLKLSKPALKAARKAVRGGGKVVAKVLVKTTEDGSPTTKQRLRIRLK